jgi:chromosome partition protein MukB
MKRTVAEALVLVNWKGIFYERFLLNRHVTALEGANGAGKTTVMIAAYTVLLPDMSRLRFTNLGESGAIGGDKGIHGRLGEPGRPSYAALDFRLAGGERFIAGVHLERRAEPTVEPTPFVITGLSEDTSLQEVLLDRGEVDAVPDLGRLRELVTLAGAYLKVCPSAKDYFAELFERGVTPLRLATDEDRNKLNEMLRTSMVGGISRALTGGMREFLLKEETGLGDTLKSMRANLDACRRTRTEVTESQRLEKEISDVQQVGQDMFAAAVHATRTRADELRTRVEEARRELQDLQNRREELALSTEQARERHLRAAKVLTKTRTTLNEATQVQERTQKAHRIHQRIQQKEQERKRIVLERDAKGLIREQQERARELAHKDWTSAREDMNAAAQGLASFSKGFAELERRAAMHRRAVEALEEARSALPEENITPENLREGRERCQTRIRELDAATVRHERELTTAELRSNDFSATLQALGRLTLVPVEPGSALAQARTTLVELRRMDEFVAELPKLPSLLTAARQQAERQLMVRRQAAELSTEDQLLETGEQVRAAFEEANAAQAALQQQIEQERLSARDAEQLEKASRQRIGDLEVLLQRWRETRSGAEALTHRWRMPTSSRSDLDTLRRTLQERRDETLQEQTSIEAERLRVHQEWAQLASAGGNFNERLLRARDLTEGELLAGRFEEVPIEDAGEVQARLGPLHEAIVVEDVESAARKLSSVEDVPETVWLIGGDATLELDTEGRPAGERMGASTLVRGSTGWRLTRIPAHPILGRKARERRMGALRQHEQRLESQLEELRAEQRALSESLEQVAALSAQADLLDQPDPAPALEAARDAAAQAASARARHEAALRTFQERVQPQERRRQALTGLLEQAHLLDAPDAAEVVQDIASRLEKAQAAATRLSQSAEDRKFLEEHLDVLQTPPPSQEERTRLKKRLQELEAERDRLAIPLHALEFLEENRTALTWTDAEPALQSQRDLEPALQEQYQRAEKTHQKAEHRMEEVRTAADAAIQTHEAACNAVNALDESLRHIREELRETGIADASEEALASAQRRCEELSERLTHHEQEEREANNAFVRLENQHQQAAEKVKEKARSVEDEERAWRPVQETWERLQEVTKAQGVLAPTLSEVFRARFKGLGSVNLWQEAKTHAAALIVHIQHARDGAELATEVKRWLEGGDQSQGEVYLQAWLRVREWLRRRVPPQIAEANEPLEALLRLREHLARLQDRLAQQESNLRGQSRDVATHIDIQIRKARKQVSRLNADLESVRFGSIQGVRIRVRGMEKMERILRALREGEAQHLLFQTHMPIEEALDELFRQYGGGRTGGHKLLDYREYVDLQVEVRRQSGQDWEPANPTRLSTGEAIGVGAAVMMVVLTAWEQDANLLRTKRSAGTLRFLFLDEATRLSQDNLGILFDLCQNLELQLLIAAPEVARAEGNTTYRLVRQLGGDGREEVLVTGRRTINEVRA